MPGYIVYADDGGKRTEACDTVAEVVVRLLKNHASLEDLNTVTGRWFEVAQAVVDRAAASAADTAVVPQSDLVRYVREDMGHAPSVPHGGER